MAWPRPTPVQHRWTIHPGAHLQARKQVSQNVFIQAAKVILMRPHNWERFSFGAWLRSAALRLHRNKLATALANKLARISWSILRNEKSFEATHHNVMAI